MVRKGDQGGFCRRAFAYNTRLCQLGLLTFQERNPKDDTARRTSGDVDANSTDFVLKSKGYRAESTKIGNYPAEPIFRGGLNDFRPAGLFASNASRFPFWGMAARPTRDQRQPGLKLAGPSMRSREISAKKKRRCIGDRWQTYVIFCYRLTGTMERVYDTEIAASGALPDKMAPARTRFSYFTHYYMAIAGPCRKQNARGCQSR